MGFCTAWHRSIKPTTLHISNRKTGQKVQEYKKQQPVVVTVKQEVDQNRHESKVAEEKYASDWCGLRTARYPTMHFSSASDSSSGGNS